MLVGDEVVGVPALADVTERRLVASVLAGHVPALIMVAASCVRIAASVLAQRELVDAGVHAPFTLATVEIVPAAIRVRAAATPRNAHGAGGAHDIGADKAVGAAGELFHERRVCAPVRAAVAFRPR